MDTKIFSLIFLICFLIFSLSCDNPSENDTTPPNVQITFPLDGSTVSEIVEIKCMATDNDKVANVQLWVDGEPFGFKDESEPYSLGWHTMTYDDESEHTIVVRATDRSNNKKDSDPIILIVNNQDSRPTKPEISSISFKENSFYVKWKKNSDEDFISYFLYESSNSDMSNKSEIHTTLNRDDTTFVVNGIGYDQYRYYQIEVRDNLDLNTLSDIKTGFSYLKIIYHSSFDGTRDVFMMDIDGKLKTNLTHSNSFDSEAKFSPDGSKIIYNSWSNNDGEIYIMEIDGSNKKNLTNSVGTDVNPEFSPDGSKIVFISTRDGTQQIYIMNNDGTGQVNLTNTTVHESGQKFSPDGTKILYTSYQSGNHEIYIMDTNGLNKVNLTNNIGNDYSPQFSPDRSKIVYASDRTGNSHVYIMNVDGSNQTQITTTQGSYYSPQFSPDGSKILLTYFDSNMNVYLMNNDGSDLRNLTNSDGSNPVFSYDGLKIVFYSGRDKNGEIYIIDSDGSNQINLTNTENSSEESPKFQPRQ